MQLRYLLILTSSFLGRLSIAENVDTCLHINLAEIRFEKNSVQLSKLATKQLDSSLLTICKFSNYKVEVIGGAI